ncbi:sulfurtransferase [Sulfuriflexus sp.]|uniref:sulfurtransferase n=1 Tax=Sulfuriflexus sp. TaxID=2015443 RepID=UPI0028CEB2FB|nr:sulfurtransferase [Sulfuriflexus sp.]MDT8405119.1 sulfurtransferase [Sulfuriflexus sp.]
MAATDSVYVEHEWLAKNLGNKAVVVIDMTADDVQYMRYHIPGAVRISYRDIVMQRKDKVSVRLPDSQLLKVLGQAGIQPTRHVVIYDDMGGLNAGRLFWELERIGHKKVSVLRGGLVQWVLAGHKVDNQAVKSTPVQYQSAGEGVDNEADLAAVKAASEKGTATLLDVRSQEEYVGHPKYPRSGHIPGAKWAPWEDNVDFENGFVPKAAEQLLNKLSAIGVKDKDAPLIVYCRSGHRASQSYLTLRDLGFETVRLYDASMAEYSRQPALPLVKGMSEK